MGGEGRQSAGGGAGLCAPGGRCCAAGPPGWVTRARRLGIFWGGVSSRRRVDSGGRKGAEGSSRSTDSRDCLWGSSPPQIQSPSR
jgi:hypothetical protein